MSNYLYYIYTLGVYFFIYCILGFGYNLQYGLAGISNVANFVFVSFGAYIAAVVSLGPSNSLVQSYILGMSVPWPLPVLFAGIIGAATSLVLGFVFLWRIRHQYQAIVTLVFAQVAWLVFGNNTALFNGYNGLAGIPKPLSTVLTMSPVSYEAIFTAITAVAAALCLIFMLLVSSSPAGRVLRAIREDEEVAASFGRNVFWRQMMAFVASGVMAGVAGGLLAEFLGSWTPSAWTISEGFVVIAALIIGGTANNAGAALGAFIVPVLIYELTDFIPGFGGISGVQIDAARWIAIGVLALLFMWFRSPGVIPERRRTFRGFGRILDGAELAVVSAPGAITAESTTALRPDIGGEVEEQR